MITLIDNATGRSLASLTEEDLQFLVDQLEETSGADQDYWIDGDTIDLLEEAGGSRPLVAALRGAVGEREGIEVRWVRG